MLNTTTSIGFTDSTTVQLRLELGSIIEGVQTTDVPAGLSPNDDGFVWDSDAGQFIGRITGTNSEFWQPFDTYQPSAIEDLFDFDPAAALPFTDADDEDRWSVTVNGVTVEISGVSRKANILESAETDWYSFDYRTVQNIFLELDTPLTDGDVLAISFDDADFDTLTATYDPANTLSEAIHVNLAGFDPDDLVKKAYLSSWNGWEVALEVDGGGFTVAQDYDPGTSYDIVDAATGDIVKSGTITLAQPVEDPNNFRLNFNGTDVWEIDFSDITDTGNYYVAVDGVGISQTFEIGNSHWQDIFELSFSGFYHQRSGTELLAEHTAFPRPASLVPGDDLTVLRTTVKISETSEGSSDGSGDKPFDLFPDNTTGETVDAWGGWHDAGDWDRRTQHLEAARNLIELAEMAPDQSSADTLGLPESGDGIPDLLQEAMWGIEVFKRLQTEDGGIPGGIEQISYSTFGGASWTESPEVFAYGADVWSSWEYAASAAKVAHMLADYDATLAQDWLDSAIAAFDYAEANWASELDNDPAPRDVTSRNVASLELYRATEDTDYHDVFEETSVYADGRFDNVDWRSHQFESAFLYARLGELALNDTIRDTGQSDLQGEVDLLLSEGTRSGFGTLFNPHAPYGWGNTAAQPNYSAESVARLHYLTGEDALLAVLQEDVQYVLGANPLNMSFLTGLPDARGPEELLNLDAEALGYGPVPGVTVYGEYNINDYGPQGFHDAMYFDIWPNIWNAPVSESWQGASIYVPVTEYTVQQGITDMTFVTGYLAALQSPPAASDGSVSGTTGADLMQGTWVDDFFKGLAGNDVMIGRNGSDRLLGNHGDDKIYGGGANDDLRGGMDDDTLRGNDGDDILYGDAGVDNIKGQSGDDRIDGGTERDYLIGGSGADVFVFGTGYGRDTVYDFDASTDQIELSAALLGAGETIVQMIEDHGRSYGDGTLYALNFGGGDIVVLKSLTALTDTALQDAILIG